MFRGHVRRSGSLRGVWHKRERKRRPLDRRPAEPLAQPQTQPQPVAHPHYVPTEAEWLSGKPGAMLRCLVHHAAERGPRFRLSHRAIQRKYRLFYCACCRLRWDILPDPARQAVEVIERYADGQGSVRDIRAARRKADNVVRATRPLPRAGEIPPHEWNPSNAARLAVAAAEVHVRLRLGGVSSGWPVSLADQAELLGELFGNPFAPAAIAPAWLTPTVVALAKLISAERALELMPVLGDALQDAGSTHAEILGHCYSTVPHVAGCWLVDRLTGQDSPRTARPPRVSFEDMGSARPAPTV